MIRELARLRQVDHHLSQRPAPKVSPTITQCQIDRQVAEYLARGGKITKVADGDSAYNAMTGRPKATEDPRNHISFSLKGNRVRPKG